MVVVIVIVVTISRGTFSSARIVSCICGPDIRSVPCVVGVVRVKVVVVISCMTACDKPVVVTMFVCAPAIIVVIVVTGMIAVIVTGVMAVIVTGMAWATPTVVSVMVPAVIAVRIVPAPSVVESAVIVTVRIVVRTIVVGRPVPVIAEVDAHAPVVRVVIIPIHIGIVGIVVSPAVVDVGVKTANARRIVVVIVIVVVIIIVVCDISVACFAVIIALRSRIVCGGRSFFRIFFCNIFFGIIIGFRRNSLRPVYGRSGRVLCIGGSAIDIVIV